MKYILLCFSIFFLNSCFLLQDWVNTSVKISEMEIYENIIFCNDSTYNIIISPNNQNWWSEFNLAPGEQIVLIRNTYEDPIINYSYNNQDYLDLIIFDNNDFILLDENELDLLADLILEETYDIIIKFYNK